MNKLLAISTIGVVTLMNNTADVKAQFPFPMPPGLSQLPIPFVPGGFPFAGLIPGLGGMSAETEGVEKDTFLRKEPNSTDQLGLESIIKAFPSEQKITESVNSMVPEEFDSLVTKLSAVFAEPFKNYLDANGDLNGMESFLTDIQNNPIIKGFADNFKDSEAFEIVRTSIMESNPMKDIQNEIFGEEAFEKLIDLTSSYFGTLACGGNPDCMQNQ